MGGMGRGTGGCHERRFERVGGADVHCFGDGRERMDTARLDGHDRSVLHPLDSGGLVRGFHAL